jgi:hypothetical protein
MVRFKDFNDELKSGAALETTCPKDPVSVDVALDDY